MSCITAYTGREPEGNYLTLLKMHLYFLPTAYHRYFCFFSSNVSGFKLFQGQDDGAAISRDEIRNYI